MSPAVDISVLPQGKVEAKKRVCLMTEEMLRRGFGNCTNHYECQAACPKGIKVSFIAQLNREFIKTLCSGPIKTEQRSDSLLKSNMTDIKIRHINMCILCGYVIYLKSHQLLRSVHSVPSLPLHDPYATKLLRTKMLH